MLRVLLKNQSTSVSGKNVASIMSTMRSERCFTSTTDPVNQQAASATKEKPKPDMVEIFIDDKPLMVEKGITILEAAKLAGVEIPRFCYHERLSIAGNCRMCLVEVEKSIKPVASCAMPVMMPGMRVKTNSPLSKKAREGVMEFLLHNHPLDCPICDQGGECDLQDQSMAFGSDRSRKQIFYDGKRAVEDKNIGPLVKTIMTRCIHCTRCVRFMNEIGGCEDLGTTGRGSDMQIGTYLENTLLMSELSGNIVDICPVGALTSKPYTFNARPWELRRINSIDVLDAVGSNIVVCSRSGDLMRILPRVNEDINEEWLADKSRHAPVDGLKNQRLTVPLLRPSRGSTLQPCDWEDALITISSALTKTPAKRMQAIVGPMTDVETIVAIKDLFDALGANGEVYVHVPSDVDPGCIPDVEARKSRGNYLFNSTIAGLEDGVDCVLLVGTNPRFEAPMVNARIRKAWRSNSIETVALVGEEVDLLYDYDYLGDSTSVLQEILDGKHKFVEVLRKAERPVLILGQQIQKQDSGASNVYHLARAIAKKYDVEFNVLHAAASTVGAYDLGLKPSTERHLIDGSEPSLVWLFGVDDPAIAVGENCFTIYQGHNGDICANVADAVLPGAAFTEKQATFVNTEGRVQQALQAITTPGHARDDWKILRACSEMANHILPYDDLTEIRERMVNLAPHLSKMNRIVAGEITGDAKVSSVKPSKIVPKLKTILDYYQTDSISRSSPTMAKCITAVQEAIEKKKTKSA